MNPGYGHVLGSESFKSRKLHKAEELVEVEYEYGFAEEIASDEEYFFRSFGNEGFKDVSRGNEHDVRMIEGVKLGRLAYFSSRLKFRADSSIICLFRTRVAISPRWGANAQTIPKTIPAITVMPPAIEAFSQVAR